jgi:hypothetical protein
VQVDTIDGADVPEALAKALDPDHWSAEVYPR